MTKNVAEPLSAAAKTRNHDSQSTARPRSMRTKLLSAVTFALGVAALGAAPVHAAVSPDAPPGSPPGTDPNRNAIDTANTRPAWVGLGIRNEAGNGGGTCTGLLINPRTVLFAAHCVDALNPAAYDGNSPGNRAQVGYTTDPTFGNANLRQWLFGQDFGPQPGADGRTMTGSSVMVWYDPRSRFGSAAVPNNGTFLPADVALAGFDTANELLGRDAQSGIGLLFTPVAGLVPVTIGGFGQSGNGFTNARISDFNRRLGQNMLGFLGSERDIAIGVYGATVGNLFEPGDLRYQDLYWVDFDDPQRATRPFFAGPGADPLCPPTNANCRVDHDPFPGNAVPNEIITAAGDSGSPLVTNAFGRDVSLGVLSQGSRFFYDSIGNPDDDFVRNTNFSNFGTTAGYNPLFLFWDQIVVNNPYKYVTTVAGDGEWTNAARWVQEIDPLYFTLAGSTLVNALPTTPALGMSDAATNVGTVRPSPSPIAACALTGTCPSTGGRTDPEPVPSNMAMPGTQDLRYTISVGGDNGPTTASPGYESLIANTATNSGASDSLLAGQNAHTTGNGETIVPGTAVNAPMTTALWSSGTLIPVNSGTLTGPGTTNFVPNNTLGTPGLQNSTRWFEVNLRAAGTTFLTGTTVTIDRLSVRGASSGLNIRAGARLNTVISSFLDAGTLTVNGIFAPSRLTVGGGSLFGTGSILTTATSGAGLLVNGGTLSPGAGAASVGTLSVTGNTAFTLAGVYGVDIASATSADRLNVTGQLLLGGGFAANALGYTPNFGDRWTVASATGGITGNFAVVASNFQGVLRPQLTTVGNDLQLSVIALPFRTAATFTSAEQAEIARGLDAVRTAGGYSSLQGLFAALDPAPLTSLPTSFQSMAPLNNFLSSGLAETFSAQTTEMLDQRGNQIVNGGGRGFSSAGLHNLVRAPQLASADPIMAMRIGATAFANAQDEASGMSANQSPMKLADGWGGYLHVGKTFDTKFAVTPFAGDANVDAFSVSLGFDKLLSDDSGSGYVGGAVTYNNGKAKLANLAQTSDVDSYGLNLYAGARSGHLLFDLQAGYSFQNYDLERAVTLIPGTQRLTGSTDGNTWTAAAQLGREIPVGQGSSLTPFIGIDGSWTAIDAYSETGGSAALFVNDRKSDRVDGRAGIAYRGSFASGSGQIRPMASVAYATDLSSNNNVVDASFAGFTSVPMAFQGIERKDGWVEYELGLEYEGPQVGVAINFAASDNGQLDYKAVAARVSIAF